MMRSGQAVSIHFDLHSPRGEALAGAHSIADVNASSPRIRAHQFRQLLGRSARRDFDADVRRRRPPHPGRFRPDHGDPRDVRR
jgi:hypothetical protein